MDCSFYKTLTSLAFVVLCGPSFGATEVRIQGMSDQRFCKQIKELYSKHPNLSDFRKQLATTFPSKEVVVLKTGNVVQVKLRSTQTTTQVKVVDREKKLPKKVLTQIEHATRNAQQPGHPIDRYKLSNLCLQISYTLRAQLGYKNPQVNYSIQGDTLSIIIIPGPQELVDQVSVTVLPRELSHVEKTLKKDLSIKTYRWNRTPCVPEILETQRTLLLKALRDMGYQDASISVSVTRSRKVSVGFTVLPGKRYAITKVEWIGDWPNSVTKTIAARFYKQRQTVWLSARNVRLLRKQVEEALKSARRDHETSHSVSTNQASGTATIIFQLNSPEYWTVGTVSVVGNKKTYIDTLLRTSDIHPGDVVTPKKLRNFYKRSLVHFSDIKIDRSNPHRTTLLVTERPGHETIWTYSQASYNPYDGLDFGVGVEWRDLNFCGLAIPVQYNIEVKDTGYSLLVGLRYPYPFGLNANIYTTFDLRHINAERLLSSIFRRGQASIIPSFVTLSCRSETGIHLPLSDKFSVEPYLAIKFEQYGLTQYSLSRSAITKIDTLGLSDRAMHIVETTNIKHLLASYAQTRSAGLSFQIESAVERIDHECGSRDASKLRRLVNSIVALPFLSQKVFDQEVFPMTNQALLTVGNRFVYSDLDDHAKPTAGYQVGCDVSATTGTTSFTKLILTGTKYFMVGEDQVITARAKAGKLAGNHYWINNFGMHDFPCSLVDYEPASGLISPYRVGGSMGANFSIAMPLASKEFFDIKLFGETGCIWDSGLDVDKYNIFGNDFSFNFTPGVGITVYIPMLFPVTFSIGLPQVYGDARYTSFTSLAGIHCGFKFGGSY